MLSTGAGASVGINTQIIIIDIQVNIFFDFGHNIQRYKGCLSLALCIEGRNTHQTVHTFFGLQVSISIETVDLEGHRLDACLVPVQIIQHFYIIAFLFSPPCIHTIQHGCPVTAFGSAGTGIQLENRIVLIVFTGKKCLDTDVVQSCDKLFKFILGFCRKLCIILFIAHFDKGHDILIL